MFPLYEQTQFPIQIPPRKVSRRNYRHPARLYAREARRAEYRAELARLSFINDLFGYPFSTVEHIAFDMVCRFLGRKLGL